MRAPAGIRNGKHSILTLGLIVVVAAVLLIVQNVAIDRYFPHLTRLTTDFSAAYLQRELDSIAKEPPQTIFLGDSVLWGYRLAPGQTAVAILQSQGCRCRNLAFKSGSPPNDYFLARLLLAAGIRPRTVVLDVNQAVLNQSSDYYQTLHPGVALLADSLLNAGDRSTLTVPAPQSNFPKRADAFLSSYWALYALRSDIREHFLGEPPPAPLPRLTSDLFEGTYDLVPLDQQNTGVRYLEKTVELLRRDGIPVIAFMTPTNHSLLHKFIDNSHYQANIAFLTRQLRRRGARVLDLDGKFPQNEFLDNAHLTRAGQQRLASLLRRELGNT